MAPQPPPHPKLKKLFPIWIIFGVPFVLGIMGLLTFPISRPVAAVFAVAAIISFPLFAILMKYKII